MAMYYYASKISAIACGTRCKQSVLQKNRGQRDRDKEQFYDKQQNHQQERMPSTLLYKSDSTGACNFECYDERNAVSMSGTTSTLTNGDSGTIMGRTKELPEVNCDTSPSENIVIDADGVKYKGGEIVAGPLDALINLLIPTSLMDLDKDFIFSFLLSSRFFIQPFELLGQLVATVPENESQERLVSLLGIWTKTFPYDFRDERIMCHVKHIVARCTNTGLGDLVSELLSALLNRLTELEQHEEELRACQSTVSTSEKTVAINWPSTSSLAQILCHIERKLAKHVGPEEFLQCSSHILLRQKNSDIPPTGPLGVQDSKKTCNLESYLDWSARLRLLVPNEILLCKGHSDRSKMVELWSGVAQYCLLVGNYNSATVILEALESAPIARLQVTWSKLSSTSQQLNCMQRHAEGCGDLWHKQTDAGANLNKCAKDNESSNSSSGSGNNEIGMVAGSGQQQDKRCHSAGVKSRMKSSNDWVVLPVFADIVHLALSARDECLQKLPLGHLNVAAFDRLSAIVGAFTRHMNDAVSSGVTNSCDFHEIWRHIHSCPLRNESELMLSSFECEAPSEAEKHMYDLT